MGKYNFKDENECYPAFFKEIAKGKIGVYRKCYICKIIFKNSEFVEPDKCISCWKKTYEIIMK